MPSAVATTFATASSAAAIRDCRFAQTAVIG
jgi:hypothetical protein